MAKLALLVSFSHISCTFKPILKNSLSLPPPRQQSSAFGLPPPAADVICGQPLSGNWQCNKIWTLEVSAGQQNLLINLGGASLPSYLTHAVLAEQYLTWKLDPPISFHTIYKKHD